MWKIRKKWHWIENKVFSGFNWKETKESPFFEPKEGGRVG